MYSAWLVGHPQPTSVECCAQLQVNSSLDGPHELSSHKAAMLPIRHLAEQVELLGRVSGIRNADETAHEPDVRGPVLREEIGLGPLHTHRTASGTRVGWDDEEVRSMALELYEFKRIDIQGGYVPSNSV